MRAHHQGRQKNCDCRELKMYDALYSENIGLGGFSCRTCRRVTRTERGMRAHCWAVHQQKRQIELFHEETGTRSEASEPIPATGNSATAARTTGGDLCTCHLSAVWRHSASVHKYGP